MIQIKLFLKQVLITCGGNGIQRMQGYEKKICSYFYFKMLHILICLNFMPKWKYTGWIYNIIKLFWGRANIFLLELYIKELAVRYLFH